MPRVKLETHLTVSPDALWRMIGGFNALPQWHPSIEKSETEGEGRGAVRKLKIVGGPTLVERLEHVSDSERVYRYSIVDSPMPVSSYVSEIRVRDNRDGTSTVEWSAEFEPKGAPEMDVAKMIQDVYRTGLDNLKKMYGG